MPRIAAVVAAILAALLVAPVAPAVADDGYPPTGIPTETTIEVEAEFSVGEQIEITYEVNANAEAEGPIEGTLDVTITGGAGADTARAGTITESYDYSGSPITQNIGRQSPGDYTVTAAFTPDEGSSYLPSDAAEDFRVVTGSGTTPGQPSSNGILPNAGGFSAWWLLLALLLVAGGGTAVIYARRSATD